MSLILDFKASEYHYEHSPLSDEKLQEVESWISPDQEKYAPGRLKEWLAGRYCAKKAAEKTGVFLKSLSSNKDRSPAWPDDIVGSISHTKDFAISVVSKKAKRVGIDCENLMATSRYESLKRMFVREEEKLLLDSNRELAPTLCFSAKEALYKNVASSCKCYFGFHEATLKSFSKNKFLIELHSDNPLVSPFNGEYEGSYSLSENLLLTFIESL